MKKFNITAPQSLSAFLKSSSTKSTLEKNNVLQIKNGLDSCIGVSNTKDLVLG
jgi:hypothetical protein